MAGKDMRAKVIGVVGGVSGAGSILGSMQACHYACMALIALMGVMGITITGMPFFFFTKIVVPLWLVALVLLGTIYYLYAKARCISKNLLLFNSGLLIAGTPFRILQPLHMGFLIVGGTVAAVGAASYVAEKLRKNPGRPSSPDCCGGSGQKDREMKSAIRSPYAGQETREIKAFASDEVSRLAAGSGTCFGGMAKPAELNAYPGPLHVLDAHEEGEFGLTAEQLRRTRAAYDLMHVEAVKLGALIIRIERQIDDAFAARTVTEGFLRDRLSESADAYGKLRATHLNAHLSMMDILTPQQVERYSKLRGYV